MSDEPVEPAIRPVDGQDPEPAVRRIDQSADGTTAPAGTDDLPPVSALTGPERRLDPRVRYQWALGAVVGAAVAGAIAAVAGLFLFDDPVTFGAGAFLVLAAVGLVFAVLRYRVWRYEVRTDSLFLERGVVTRVRTVVPYVRIQHVDVSRGPVERTLGLASVVVYTAGSRGADVTIPGMTPERADDLQARLKQLAIVAEGEDAV
jgi:membrane protein YdbS with pleckstrin-like domain